MIHRAISRSPGKSAGRYRMPDLCVFQKRMNNLPVEDTSLTFRFPGVFTSGQFSWLKRREKELTESRILSSDSCCRDLSFLLLYLFLLLAGGTGPHIFLGNVPCVSTCLGLYCFQRDHKNVTDRKVRETEER